jgi:hypothetical protein
MSAHLYTFTNAGMGGILLHVPQQDAFLFAFMAWCNGADKLITLPLRFVICVYVYRFEGGYQPVGPSERLVTTYQVIRCHTQKAAI